MLHTRPHPPHSVAGVGRFLEMCTRVELYYVFGIYLRGMGLAFVVGSV